MNFVQRLCSKRVRQIEIRHPEAHSRDLARGVKKWRPMAACSGHSGLLLAQGEVSSGGSPR